MGRKPGKVSLRLIENAGLRRRTMAKRKEGLKKKLHELTKLCDLDACMLIYCDALPVDTWPQDQTLVSQTIQRYLLDQQSTIKFDDDDDDWDKRLEGLSKEGLTDLLNSLDAKLNHANIHSFTPPPPPPPLETFSMPNASSNAAHQLCPGLFESDFTTCAADGQIQSTPHSGTNMLFPLFEKHLHHDADKMNIHQLLAMLNSPDHQHPFPSLYEYDHLLPSTTIADPTLGNAAAPPLVYDTCCTSSYSHSPGLLEPSFSLMTIPANTTSLWS